MKYKQHYTCKHDLTLLAKIWHASTPPKQSPQSTNKRASKLTLAGAHPYIYTGTDRQTDRQTDRHTHTHTNACTKLIHSDFCFPLKCYLTVIAMSLEENDLLNILTKYYTHRHAHTDTDTDRHTDTHTDTHRHTQTHTHTHNKHTQSYLYS